MRIPIGAFLLMFAAIPPQAKAGVIIDVGAMDAWSGPAVQSMQYLQQGWTQTEAYVDVTISVLLLSWTPDVPFHVSALLTTNTGFGATPPPLTSTVITGVTAAAASQTYELFNGLALGPGTYYLTLSGTDVGATAGAIWLEGPLHPTFIATGITLPGVDRCTAPIQCTPNIGYPPASMFEPVYQDTISASFSMTGTAVPEPSTNMLVLTSAAIAMLAVRVRNLVCKCALSVNRLAGTHEATAANNRSRQ